ncbi:unnamed protein product [Cuscuta campestris]|uniref:Uncharacterized protein n=1 Tax=Cuscuta campestris TaxID=132261 RepID=A0A484LCF1_9ASTE|nr:unnamed protein product [Cuscuta campestris]
MWLALVLALGLTGGYCEGGGGSRGLERNEMAAVVNHGNNFTSGSGVHYYFNLLPKRFPVPASTPSRRHNDIGLRTWKTP